MCVFLAIQFITFYLFSVQSTGENVQNGDHSEAHLSTFSQSSKEVSSHNARGVEREESIEVHHLQILSLAHLPYSPAFHFYFNNYFDFDNMQMIDNMLEFTIRINIITAFHCSRTKLKTNDILIANFYYGSRMYPRTVHPRKTRRRRRACAHHHF